jgi:hypothetical protein
MDSPHALPAAWLPYRYLGPFVSERCEVVPPAMGQEIFGALRLRASGGMGMNNDTLSEGNGGADHCIGTRRGLPRCRICLNNMFYRRQFADLF